MFKFLATLSPCSSRIVLTPSREAVFYPSPRLTKLLAAPLLLPSGIMSHLYSHIFFFLPFTGATDTAALIKIKDMMRAVGKVLTYSECAAFISRLKAMLRPFLFSGCMDRPILRIDAVAMCWPSEARLRLLGSLVRRLKE